MGEGTVAPREDGLKWLADSFKDNYQQYLPMPYVFPTSEGDIEMEWARQHHNITVILTISLRDKTAQWFSFVSAEDDSNDTLLKIDLKDAEGWDRLNQLIYSYIVSYQEDAMMRNMIIYHLKLLPRSGETTRNYLSRTAPKSLRETYIGDTAKTRPASYLLAFSDYCVQSAQAGNSQ